MVTKTEQIFELTAPCNNPYQGNEPRLLFVCSVGLLRSPTCADAATKLGFNARSCGSAVDMALIPISVNLMKWADKIIFVNNQNFKDTVELFKFDQDISEFKRKSIIWDIEDDYERNDDWLIAVANTKLEKLTKELSQFLEA